MGYNWPGRNILLRVRGGLRRPRGERRIPIVNATGEHLLRKGDITKGVNVLIIMYELLAHNTLCRRIRIQKDFSYGCETTA